jgi:hypothetical protein
MEYPLTVLGLTLNIHREDLGIPVGAVVIVKAFHDGEHTTIPITTDGLSLVDALGMIEYAHLCVDNQLRQHINQPGEPQDGPSD